MPQYRIPTFFHQPFWRTRGSADADGLHAVEPVEVDLFGPLDLVAVGVHRLALLEEHLTVGALLSADKEDEVVARGKLGDVGHAVGHLSADGVEAAEGSAGGDVALDIVDDAVELFEALGGLRVEVDVAVEVEPLHIVDAFDDDGSRQGLPHQSQHLGVAVLAEDDNLRIGVVVKLPLNAALQGQHHGAGSIDDLDIVSLGQLVGLGGLAVGPKQHLHIVQLPEVIVIDGDQSM